MKLIKKHFLIYHQSLVYLLSQNRKEHITTTAMQTVTETYQNIVNLLADTKPSPADILKSMDTSEDMGPANNDNLLMCVEIPGTYPRPRKSRPAQINAFISDDLWYNCWVSLHI